jgi:molecular chaperone GrpE
MINSKKEKADKKNVKSEMDNNEIEAEKKEENEINIQEEDINQSNASDKKETKKLKELESKVENLRDQLLRKAAELENYKRRTENEISGVYKFANEALITELLPALEDFNRMMKLWDEKHDIETFKKGVELVYDKFRKILEKQGLKEIESVGKPFDVNLHDALMQEENNELEPDTITNEIEKGYYLKDKVIKHAKVVVSKKPE